MFVSPRHRVSLLDRKVGQFAHQVLETLPETAAELASLLESAQADINVIRARHAAGETLTGADATRLRALLADVDRVGAAHAAAVLAEAGAAPADADEIGALLAQADAPADEAPEGSATDAPADEAPEGGDAPADAPAGDAPQVPVAASGQPAPVTNGSRPVTFGAAVTGAEPETPEGDTPTPGWVMQPGVPGYQPNAKVGFAQLAKQLDTIRPGSRSVRGNRPDKYMDGQSFSAQVVSALTRDVEVVDDPHALVAAINKATSLVKGERVTAASLTAAGGWCAPSEQLYDFCDVPDATDLLSLPEITINRGGIRWPREPDLSGIFEDFEWFFTEPELEATDPVTGAPTAIKQCVEIPCPEDFDEIRLNAVGWCVEAGILQEQGWPELIEWFMRSLTQEHLRALSRRSILNIVAGSGAAKVIPPASVLGSVASVLNSLALKYYGIDAQTQTPAGGVIVRKPGTNEPYGLIMETAFLPVFEKTQPLTPQQEIEGTKAAHRMYAEAGITTAHEGVTHLATLQTLERAAAAGAHSIDVVAYPFITDVEKILGQFPVADWGKYHQRLKIGGVKITIDGSPQGRTAAFTTPYLTGGPGGEKNWKGELAAPQEVINQALKRVYGLGVPVTFHVNGDAAIDSLLQAHAFAAAGDLSKDRNVTAIHAQFTRKDQIPLFVKYKIRPSFYTLHTYYVGEAHIKNRGKEQAMYMSPMRDAIDAGLRPTNHTDAVVAPLDQMFMLWSAVNRVSRANVEIGPEQRVTPLEGLKAMTLWAAEQYGEQASKGSLETGKLADLVILDKNPLKVDKMAIKDIKVLQTIKEGKSIYTAP